MPFFEFIGAPDVWPFSVALILFFAVAIVEIGLALIGIGSDLGLDVDADVDLDVDVDVDADVEIDAEVDGHAPHFSLIGQCFDWLGLGRVPYLVSIAAYLLLFGLSGLLIQNHFMEGGGQALPWLLLALGCGVGCLPLVALVNRLLGKIWPKDAETSALSKDALIGREAEVTLGEVSSDAAGQIKVRDPNGTMHYVLALSDNATERFGAGDSLLVVGRQGQHYIVRRNPLSPLQPETNHTIPSTHE